MHHQKRLFLAAGIIAIVIIGGFVLSVPHARDTGLRLRQDAVQTPPAIFVRDVFKKGVHTLSGTYHAPDACTAVSATAALDSVGSTSLITLAVTAPGDDGICLEVPTDVSFTATVTAPANTPIRATVNGVTASTTLL